MVSADTGFQKAAANIHLSENKIQLEVLTSAGLLGEKQKVLLAKVRTKAMYLTTKHVEAVSTSLEQVTEQAMGHLDHLPKLGGGLGAVDAYKMLVKHLYLLKVQPYLATCNCSYRRLHR